MPIQLKKKKQPEAPAEETPVAGEAQVEATKTDGDKNVTHVEQGNEVVDAPTAGSAPAEHMAEVGVSLGSTINLGDFNSLKCSISIRMPSQPESVDEAIAFCEEWAMQRLEQLVEKASA